MTARAGQTAADLINLTIATLSRLVVEDVTRKAACAVVRRHALDRALVVVAEGIEHPEQAARMHQAGVELSQGYLLARPQPAVDTVPVVSPGVISPSGA